MVQDRDTQVVTTFARELKHEPEYEPKHEPEYEREHDAEAKRIGVVGIVVRDRLKSAPKVNQVLSAYAHVIIGRMGIPYQDRGVSVIALIVDGDTDTLGAMTGKLGSLPGVKVKTAITV